METTERDTTSLVEMRDLFVHYPVRGGLIRDRRQSTRAVDGVSLSITKGETLGIVGGTGSGKSTITQILMGMVRPTSGTVRIGDRNLAELKGRALKQHRRSVQVVLQDPYSSLDPRMRVGDIIAEPLTMGRARGRRDPKIQERITELLRLVGLPETKSELYPHQFSGGQRQRIAIARALAPSPDLIVLDEPTSALDASVRAQILNLLGRLQRELGITYLVISHDLVTVAYLSTDVAVMFRGRIMEVGTVKQIYESPCHPYTLLLLASAPAVGGKFMDYVDLSRDPGQTVPTDAACRFASRCDLRHQLGDPARCITEEPELAPVGQARRSACHFSDRVEEFTRS